MTIMTAVQIWTPDYESKLSDQEEFLDARNTAGGVKIKTELYN